MYVSSYLTLDTALSGVEAAQEELDTTGENITNANTADYEEQSVNLVETDPLSLAGASNGGALQLGTGVDAASVSNTGDAYLDAAWRSQNATSTAATTTQNYLEQIDTALDEPSTTGINSQLEQFWSDWNNLADNPTAASAQQAVVDDGEGLATAFNSLSTALNGIDPSDPSDPANAGSVMGQVNDQYTNLMQAGSGTAADGGDIYNDAFNVSSLNESIVQAQAAGQSANTLIDQRNAALDNLSSLGNVTVQNNTDGSVTVYFGGIGDSSTGSGALVSDPASAGAAALGSPDPGNNFTTWSAAVTAQYGTASTAGTSASALGESFGGTVGALIDLAGYSSGGFGSLSGAATQLGTIGTVTQSLDSVASTLASEVNAPAVVNDSGAAVTLTNPFFVSLSGGAVTADTLAVSSALTTSPTSLQVSSTGTSSAGSYSSDNDVALDEANNSGGAADTSYQAFVQQVGDLAQGADNDETTQSALQTQLTNQRESVEGVDLSTEMANLITEQQSYQASAKVMDAFSTVMDSLMSVVGQG